MCGWGWFARGGVESRVRVVCVCLRGWSARGCVGSAGWFALDGWMGEGVLGVVMAGSRQKPFS